MKKKKLLITTNNMVIGGIERVLLNFLKEIDYTKYDIDLVLFERVGPFLEEIPNEVNLSILTEQYDILKIDESFKRQIYLKIKHFFRKINHYDLYMKFLYKNHKKKYDAAFAFHGYNNDVDYYAGLSNAKHKYIWVHTDFVKLKEYQSWFSKAVVQHHKKYKYFNNIVAVSKKAGESVVELFPEHKNKIIVLWNLCTNITKQKAHTRKNKIYNILSVGRVVKNKGFDTIIKVQKRLNDNGYKTVTNIVGDGEYKKELEQKVKKMKLKNIIFHGYQREVSKFYNSADLYVMASKFEGFGMVLLESLTAGVPIVTTDVSWVEDLKQHIAPVGSLIIVKDNEKAIYDGVKRAIEGEIKRGFIFDIDEYNEMVFKKYLNLIDGKINNEKN